MYQSVIVVACFFLTLTDPLRIQPWSQDRRNQTKSNRESEISRESRQKRTDKKVASKGHRRDKIENTNKNTQTVKTSVKRGILNWIPYVRSQLLYSDIPFHIRMLRSIE